MAATRKRTANAGPAHRNGPVAQLGARFHGMEEVDGSNPSRSTKFLKTRHFSIVNGNLKQEIDRFHGAFV